MAKIGDFVSLGNFLYLFGKFVPFMETNQVQHSLQSANATIQAETIRAVDEHIAGNPVPSDNTTLQQVWQVARPVLVFLEAALFLAPGWHKALKALVGAIDSVVSDETPMRIK